MSDRLIRIEYDESQRFVDEPTDAFIRATPAGSWQNSSNRTSGDWTVIETSSVYVYYKRLPPTAGSVLITGKGGSSDAWPVWRWGDAATGRLPGTARTLDHGAETLDLNCSRKVSPTMSNSEMHCTWGIVSREGWAVVNDTGMPVWRDGWYVPSNNSIDVHVFFHGLDFAGALRDFAHAAGPPALPPRYALGTMFSRWMNLDTDSVASMIRDFESHSMPLDAWIFDMNWHVHGPWGSYTWNREAYPRVQDLLDWIQSKGLYIGANTHDHDGISTQEETYERVCEALRRFPCNASIPFDLYNKTYVDAVEGIAWGALETRGGKQGFDFAWIDYQQGESDSFEKTRIPNINPTAVLNRLRSTTGPAAAEKRRSMILSRWGGLGSHRYPVGFSGDQFHNWTGLAFLPYFTSTAANVAYGYWSHDTVGGDRSLADDYELSVRWAQTTAWSPVFRFHDKGAGTGPCAATDACARVIPWDVPDAFFKPIREAARTREQLLPYIYTAAFSAVSTGLTLVRPMYYEAPGDPSLYGLDSQYLFGPDMIVSPITSPSAGGAAGHDDALGTTSWTVFAPGAAPGWVDLLNGEFVTGPATSVYGISDVPALVRQGAVIPMRPREELRRSGIARARQPLGAVEFRIMPAAAFYSGGTLTGSGAAVDDDGVSLEYMSGRYARMTCNYSFAGREFQVSVSRIGGFNGMPEKVTLVLSFPQLPPLKVTSFEGGASGHAGAYSHEVLGSVLTVTEVDFAKGPVKLTLTIDHLYMPKAIACFVGVLGRIRRARYAKDALDAANARQIATMANMTSYALAATQMTPDFATRLPRLWGDTKAEARVLASKLASDPKRASFISDMMELSPPSRLVV